MTAHSFSRNRGDGADSGGWRAILVGLVFACAGFYFGMYGYLIVQVLHWSTTALQMGSVLVLFVVVLISALLGLLRRRWRLQPWELLIVFTISTIFTSIGAHGMMGYLIPMMPGAQYYATPENKWDTLFQEVPAWLTVNDPRAVQAFYEANGTLYSIETLRAWGVPLAFWLGVVFLLVIGEWAVVNIVSEQWVSHERLTFPLVQVPLAMSGVYPSRLFWRNRTMWIGFTIPMVLQSMNFLHFLYPPIPGVWLKARPVGTSITGMPWSSIRPLHVAFYPFVIGIVFLLSTETSLSCWLFYWVSKLEALLCAILGMQPGGGEGPDQLPLTNEQGTGGLLAISLTALLLTWRSIRRSARSWRAEGVQLMSSAASLAILMIALASLAVMSWLSGLPVWVGVVYFVMWWLMNLAWARVSAETGSAVNWLIGATGQRTLLAFAGTTAIRATGLPMFATFSTFEDYSDSAAVQLLAVHKFREVGAVPRRLLRNAVLVAIVVAIVYTAWTHLDIYYRYGGAMARMRPWYPSRGSEPWRLLASWLVRPTKPDPWQVGGYLWGALVVVILRQVRFAVPSWPFHPIGYALGHTHSMGYMWMPFLIGWLIKSVVLRYGGVKVYQRMVPFFMGMIMGDVVVAGLWGIYGVCTGQRMYMHFPH